MNRRLLDLMLVLRVISDSKGLLGDKWGVSEDKGGKWNPNEVVGGHGKLIPHLKGGDAMPEDS